MFLKSFIAATLLVSGLSTFAQADTDRTELASTCYSAPTTISVESAGTTPFDFVLTLDCQIWNYSLQVKDAEGNVVFESKDPAAVWNAADDLAGVYTWTLRGSMGSTVSYYHIIKSANVTVIK